MAANWLFEEPRIGMQPIANTSTTQNHQLGTVARAKDVGSTSLGAGEFIYLLGVASTTVGLLVNYNATTYQTALMPNTANTDNPLAVAMSANVASQYGWYQIEGLATVLKTAVAVNPQVSLFVSTTTGRVRSTASAGRQILGCRSANLATLSAGVSTVTALINRPFVQGQIT